MINKNIRLVLAAIGTVAGQQGCKKQFCPRYHSIRLGAEVGEGFPAGAKQQELNQEVVL